MTNKDALGYEPRPLDDTFAVTAVMITITMRQQGAPPDNLQISNEPLRFKSRCANSPFPFFRAFL
jgi:hypothetical protein